MTKQEITEMYSVMNNAVYSLQYLTNMIAYYESDIQTKKSIVVETPYVMGSKFTIKEEIQTESIANVLTTIKDSLINITEKINKELK